MDHVAPSPEHRIIVQEQREEVQEGGHVLISDPLASSPVAQIVLATHRLICITYIRTQRDAKSIAAIRSAFALTVPGRRQSRSETSCGHED